MGGTTTSTPTMATDNGYKHAHWCGQHPRNEPTRRGFVITTEYSNCQL